MHNLMVISPAERSKVWVYGRMLADSNLAGYMDASLVRDVFSQVEISLSG
jgi:hypothetical protein